MGFDLPDPIESFVENATDAVQWGGNLIDRLPVQELKVNGRTQAASQPATQITLPPWMVTLSTAR